MGFGLPQDSLEKLGMDATAAVERARSRSRVGRKRMRSEGPGEAMEVDGLEGSQPPKKRIHSSKSRSAPEPAVLGSKFDSEHRTFFHICGRKLAWWCISPAIGYVYMILISSSPPDRLRLPRSVWTGILVLLKDCAGRSVAH